MIADASAEIERREARAKAMKKRREHDRILLRRSIRLLDELEKLNLADQERVGRQLIDELNQWAADVEFGAPGDPPLFRVNCKVLTALNNVYDIQDWITGAEEDDPD